MDIQIDIPKGNAAKILLAAQKEGQRLSLVLVTGAQIVASGTNFCLTQFHVGFIVTGRVVDCVSRRVED